MSCLCAPLAACGGAGGGVDAGNDRDAATSRDASSGASGEGVPATLGTVTVLPGQCQRVSQMPSTTCVRVSVASPGVAAITADVAVTEPPTDVIPRGTVVFGTGGGGGGFYEADPVARAMMLRLSAGGWRLVQRGWAGSAGWIAGPGGMLAVSNRYATLLTWIHSTIHSSGATKPFCATGNSGGSAELSYALARWGCGDLLDLAIPSGGPPIVALDHFCLDGASSRWLAECLAAIPAAAFPGASPSWCSYWSPPDGRMGGPSSVVDLAYSPAMPCGSKDAAARTQLLADSAVAPGAVLDYPSTKVVFLFGVLDSGEAVAGGHYYASKITSLHSVQYVAATPHAVFSTDAGAAAIESAINTDCVARH